jgi:hypothetical protein
MTIVNTDPSTNSVESEIPSYCIFHEDIKKIFPEGDLDKTYQRISYYIYNEKVCADGTPITYKLIMDKYSNHIQSWNMIYANRDPRYWGKGAEEKRKTLFEFIGLRWYEREFVTAVGQVERNKYLFGAFSTSYLKNQLESFQKGFLNEKD